MVIFRGSGAYVSGTGAFGLSRAWCWHRIANALPTGDDRIPAVLDTVSTHTHASLPQITGSHYMVEHFLAYYALLLLS